MISAGFEMQLEVVSKAVFGQSSSPLHEQRQPIMFSLAPSACCLSPSAAMFWGLSRSVKRIPEFPVWSVAFQDRREFQQQLDQ